MNVPALWSTSTPLAPPTERTLSARRLRLAEACPRQLHQICAEWPWGQGYPRATGPGVERRLCAAMVRELVRALLVEATRHPPGASTEDLLRGIGHWTMALPRAARSVVQELLGGSRVTPYVVDTLRGGAVSGEVAKEVRRMVGRIFLHVDRATPLWTGPVEPSDGRYVDVELGHDAHDGPWRERVDLAEVSGEEVTLFAVRARWGQPGEPLDVEDDHLAVLAWLWHRTYGGARIHLRLLTPERVLERGSLSAAEIADLGRRIESRGSTSRRAVADALPRADVPRCGRCPVRQGCDAWWSSERPRDGAGAEAIVDVEVEILPSASARVREAQIYALSASVPGLEIGTTIEVAQDVCGPVELSAAEPGARLRLLSWRCLPPDEEDDHWLLRPVQASASTGWRASEVFWVG